MKYWSPEDIGKLKKIVDKLSSEDGEHICRIIQRDPFQKLYTKLSLIYVLLLGFFLLWPFDFIFKIKNDAHWIENSRGVEFLGVGQAVSNSSAQQLFDRLVNGKGLTLEAWLETEDLNQSGPARIISYSTNKNSINFGLSQAWDKLIIRLRTTKTNLTGTSPSLVIPGIFTSKTLKQMVIIYDFSEQKLYINGKQRANSDVLIGDFSNWNPYSELVIGNEVTGDTPWTGKIYYVAIYDRALTEQEVNQNYISGLGLINKGDIKHSSLRTKDPITRYVFDERKGDVIHDTGLTLKPVNLLIPKYINHKKEPFFSFSMSSLHSKSRIPDLIINILIFIPLGILIHGILRTRYGLALRISLAVLFIGTLFSFSVEYIQYFSLARNSSPIDVATNMIGITMGVLIDRAYILYLKNQTKRLQILLFDRKE